MKATNVQVKQCPLCFAWYNGDDTDKSCCEQGDGDGDGISAGRLWVCIAAKKRAESSGQHTLRSRISTKRDSTKARILIGSVCVEGVDPFSVPQGTLLKLKLHDSELFVTIGEVLDDRVSRAVEWESKVRFRLGPWITAEGRVEHFTGTGAIVHVGHKDYLFQCDDEEEPAVIDEVTSKSYARSTASSRPSRSGPAKGKGKRR